MESIIYYIVQVNDCYYQGQLDLHTFTDNEEQAFAFTKLTSAHQMATKFNGNLLRREIRYEELEELSVQQRLEYELLSEKERKRIESFCKDLYTEMYE